MSDDKSNEKNYVTASVLDERLKGVTADHAALKDRVKKLEDRLDPPGGPGVTQENILKEIETLKSEVGSMDRRIKTINKELPTILGRLKQVEERLRELEKQRRQQPSPG